MSCPYFEPHAVARTPQHANARLPLLQEYDGFCRATAEPFTAPAEHRFAHCNHGYSRAGCPNFPSSDPRSAFRYTVMKRSDAALDIICIEEQEYAPVRWHAARYFFENGSLEPEFPDSCMRAQAVAFCRSFLEKFPAGA